MTFKNVNKYFLSLVLATGLLVGCSEESKDLKYSLEQNGCATGEVKYASEADLCVALKDDARNNHCASQLRYEMFRDRCPTGNWQN